MKALVSLILIAITTVTLGAAVNPVEKSLQVELQYSNQALGLNFVITAVKQHPVRIRFRNGDREVVFEKTLYGARIYKGTFNLEHLDSGVYYVEVRHYHQKVVKELQLLKTSLRTIKLR